MNRALVLLLVSSAASAGTTLAWERLRGDEAPTRLTMKCENGNVRFEGSAGGGRVVIWDAQAKTLDVLKPQEKTYGQLTETQANAMRDKLKGLREQMKARLDTLPPEKRTQLEAMLADASGEGEQWKFTATGKKQKVGKWDCEVYDGERGAVKMQSCMVPWSAAPAKKEDLECLKGVSSLFQSLLKGIADADAATHEDLTRFPGLPVQTTRVLPDGRKAVMTLMSAERGKIGAGEFVVPKDYQLTSLDGARRDAPTQ
jgi:hypothetical protein